MQFLNAVRWRGLHLITKAATKIKLCDFKKDIFCNKHSIRMHFMYFLYLHCTCTCTNIIRTVTIWLTVKSGFQTYVCVNFSASSTAFYASKTSNSYSGTQKSKQTLSYNSGKNMNQALKYATLQSVQSQFFLRFLYRPIDTVRSKCLTTELDWYCQRENNNILHQEPNTRCHCLWRI